jgi:CBS domain containing-hemolysin-like protein
MNADPLFWVAVLGMFAAGLAATAARSLRDFSRRELEELSDRRQNQDRFAEILHNHDRVALGVDMLVACLLTLAVTSASIRSWEHWLPESLSQRLWLLFALVVALGFISTVATVWLPWSICRVAAAQFLYYSWPIWSLLGRVFLPLVWGARSIDMLLHRATGRKNSEPDEDTIEDEILTIVSEGQREGLIEEDAREMIEGVMELGDAVVSHIMTPRTEVEMLQVNTTWADVVESVVESGHTRIPVYDKSRDDVVGILYVKDLLPELAKSDEPRRPLVELLRKPLFVPETKAVDDLLQWFQKSRTHIAVVLDEFGGVSGLVTIEDVLEEIVGEIDDEYDQKSEDLVRKIDDDVCEPLGRAHIDEINAAMGFDLPEEEDYDTIGGFVFAEFGRVPAVGESLTWNDALRVTVLDASRRRVNRVRLERVRKESLEAV